jgi:hypothetical protein
MITPHFKTLLAGSDPVALATDLANGLNTWCASTREINVKCYDAQGTKPVYPVADVTKSAGLYPASPVSRELALCLSFYGSRNVKRERGRLYFPAFLAAGTYGLRPTTGQRDWIKSAVPIFTGLGGVDVDWVVYSRVADAATTVKNWWIDDEWDIQRRRGLKATTRTVGTVSG